MGAIRFKKDSKLKGTIITFCLKAYLQYFSSVSKSGVQESTWLEIIKAEPSNLKTTAELSKRGI